MVNLEDIVNDLKTDEGYRNKIYFDIVGKRTIAYGRNLDDVGIFPDEAELMLNNDISRALNSVEVNIPWFAGLSPNRQRALVEMAFQMGIGVVGKSGLLGFQNMLQYMQKGDYKLAAQESLNSKWAMQVPKRAARIAGLINNG